MLKSVFLAFFLHSTQYFKLLTLLFLWLLQGLLCEPVQEFRESLVNPFSERFLWDKSIPRGQTWSCQDDVVLREKFCRLRKPSKGVASGLKLILLHNSQYGLWASGKNSSVEPAEQSWLTTVFSFAGCNALNFFLLQTLPININQLDFSQLVATS